MRVLQVVLVVVVLSGASSLADDAYYHVSLRSLALSEGNLPTHFQWSVAASQTAEGLQPYAVLDGNGEAFVGGEALRPWDRPETAYQHTILAVQVPKGNPITGRLFVPKADLSGMVAVKFSVGTADEKRDSKQEFFKAKENFYHRLRERNIPGAAWFRHQETEAANACNAEVSSATANPAFSPRRHRYWESDYASTYELFNNGRGLSENLQLGELVPAGSNATLVALSNLTGITVREMDWKSLLHDPTPALDPLASEIPFDQHAIFFPSLDAMRRCIEEADRGSLPVLQMFEPRAEDAKSLGRYQRQLCIEFDDLIDPKLIASIALTGSDPYFRTGTDLGVLYESISPERLKAFLQARQAAARHANPANKPVTGEFEGVAYTGLVSQDRTVSTYLAAVGKVVLMSNSRAQLERLISVAKGQTAALASQAEYLYFRQKYSRTELGETGFLVLSEATIRRWCSPRWRIGSSRRTRTAAALAELQAGHLDELASGEARPRSAATRLPETGDVLLSTNGVVSLAYGTLDFSTPIIELPLNRVTDAEAEAYNHWRTGYQQNWSQMFNPIAVRFSMQANRLGVEVCVTPLFAGAEYRQFIAMSSGARLAPGSGDPHAQALLQVALAIDPQSGPVREAGNLLGGFGPALKANPLGWLGQCVAIYADEDPFWSELAKAAKSRDFLDENYARLPVALYCEVKNPLGLAVFLAAGRALVEQKAPGLTVWESLEYNGRAYVKVTGSQRRRKEGGASNFCVYYAITSDSLVVTLSEAVLKRAFDRRSARAGTLPRASQFSPSNSTATVERLPGSNDSQVNPWLGRNLCFRIDLKFLPVFEAILGDEFRRGRQGLAWDNLPILNEWRRCFPQMDPVKVQEQFWHRTLVCPGGGHYVWNQEWQTMESSIYGSPAAPKVGEEEILPVTEITSASLGLTIENGGLSAKVVLESNAAQTVR